MALNKRKSMLPNEKKTSETVSHAGPLSPAPASVHRHPYFGVTEILLVISMFCDKPPSPPDGSLGQCH